MKKLLPILLVAIIIMASFPTISAEASTVPLILVGGAEVFAINSVGGVDVAVYWRNNTTTDIKYITFKAEPYNAVGDRVASSIGNQITMDLNITGPVSPTDINDRCFYKSMDGQNTEFYTLPNTTKRYFYSDWTNVVTSDGQGNMLNGYHHYVSGVLTPLADAEQNYVMSKTTWGTVWYNSSIRSIKIIGVDVTWMDGTTASYSGDALSSIMQARPANEV